MRRSFQRSFAIPLSFGLSVLLSLLPVAAYWPWFRPQWALLVLLYWCFYSSRGLNLWASWSVGLVLDVCSGALFGQYALLMALLNYLCSFFGHRLKLYSLFGQCTVIFILLVLSQLPLYLLYQLLAQPGSLYGYSASVLSSFCLWPLVYSLLSRYERKIGR